MKQSSDDSRCRALSQVYVTAVMLLLVTSLFATSALADPCVVPDNGTGTVDLPPAGCAYLSPDEVHQIIDGLPPGTTIELDPIHDRFFTFSRTPGGTLGGEVEVFESTLTLELAGTGDLAGFFRTLEIPIACEVHTGPRTPGDAVQTFPNDMYSLSGGIFGDPDFDLLQITGGTANGLPGPGETTLTQLPSGDFNVDSFFDITYQINFTGAPGSILDGMSGTTIATLRMQGGEDPPAPAACFVPDNGTGTIDLPPQGCDYLSPDELHQIIDGLPPGTEINISPIHNQFMNIGQTPGGSLGGEIETFDSTLQMQMNGTGALAGFSRLINVPIACEVHTGPRNPGDPYQEFDNEMVSLQGSIVGDPDFDTLTVTAGNSHGLPSPGFTKLRQQGSGDFAVDSFFDITYRIDFAGAPGGILDGFSGSTTGTVGMQAGVADAGCPPILGGDDILPTTAKLVIQRTPIGANDPIVVRLSSAGLPDTIVRRSDQVGDVIDTEIISLDLKGSHPLFGEVIVHQSTTSPSLGQITHVVQDPITCDFIGGDSFFDVYVEIDLPGLGDVWHNNDPLRLERRLRQLPPKDDKYENPYIIQIPIYDSGGTLVGYILYELHHVDPPFPDPGSDCMPWTGLDLFLNVPPFGIFGEPFHVAGPTKVQRGPQVNDPGFCCVSGLVCNTDSDCDTGDECCRNASIDTEITEMDLTGTHPVLGPVSVKVSNIQPQSIGEATTLNLDRSFPAESFFDVYVDIEIPDAFPGIIYSDPVPLAGQGYDGALGIANIPPDPGSDWLSPGATLIPLYSEDATPVGEIFDVVHDVGPPEDCDPPPLGDDYCFDSLVHLHVTIDSPYCEEDLYLNGIFRILRGDPVGVGQEVMQTLMAKARFDGQGDCLGPLTVYMKHDQTSDGEISSIAPAEFFPAESFFDVFIEVDSGIGDLHTTTAAHLDTTINALPPDPGEIYYGPGTIIPLFDEFGVKIGEILEVSHKVFQVVECPRDFYPQLLFTTNKTSLNVGIRRGGGGAVFDLVRGDLSVLRPLGSFAGATCVGFDIGPLVLLPNTTPPSGDGWYYVARDSYKGYNGTYNSKGGWQLGDRDIPLFGVCP